MEGSNTCQVISILWTLEFLINNIPSGVREQCLRRESVYVPVCVGGMKNGNLYINSNSKALAQCLSSTHHMF